MTTLIIEDHRLPHETRAMTRERVSDFINGVEADTDTFEDNEFNVGPRA